MSVHWLSVRSRSLAGRISRLAKWVANGLFGGIHSRMDPNLWSEINDTARTGLEAVQAFTTLRQTAGVPRHEAGVWRLLDRGPSRWLLVIDNADDPGLLGPSDGTGWVRGTRNGLLLITTRNGDAACWSGADLIPVLPLPLAAAADVLTDLAPDAGDGAAAAALAGRLGCLPLALGIAGMYLRQDFVSWRTFDDYRRALDTEGPAAVIGASGHSDRRLVVTRTWELSLDALASSGRPQSRPLMWLLSCFAPGSRIPEELITTTAPDPSLISLLASGEPAPGRPFAEFRMAGLRGLSAAGLIQRSNPADGPAAIEVHPFISEVTRSVMESSDPAQTGIDPRTVRECAISVIQTALSRLDPGDAEHWPYFNALTPHITGLLTGAAPHLAMKDRRTLLDGMVRCIASYMWSRAESRAEQLAVDALALARGLEADREPVYQRLRHMRAWSMREQGRFAEAEALFREVAAELMRMPGGAGAGMTRTSCTPAACCAGPSASKDACPKPSATTGSSRRTAPENSGPATRIPWTPGRTSAKPWPGKADGMKPGANGTNSPRCARQPSARGTPTPSRPGRRLRRRSPGNTRDIRTAGRPGREAPARVSLA